mmetsp:Transcript_71202/g.113184  ORF Transcript_71202/g.113184 Transcript_71202/m.113184 type:complete len:687 (+) Transcript_71202:84-2144(+)
MVKYDFKSIGVVPSATSFVDIMLSRTNRQTATVVHARWRISSIRTFYMRKIKFTQQNVCERLSKILSDFPKLDSIHPFYSDLMNVLYDRDHYKIALSQLNIANKLISNISNDYIKLLKYGDSLYRCKQLKRAALGRMMKILRQQKSSLLYLEQVRQHMSRLPCIDPYAPTLLLLGFPSTGKSSFMNKITNAKVEVAAYPFTTKSLYVGHSDYNYVRYQIIDSPGILDRPLSQRNTIEMQTITALAHLNCCILYFVDLAPHSNYSIAQQCKLFQSLQPLFHHKPIVTVCNKCDLRPFEQLSNSEQSLISNISSSSNSNSNKSKSNSKNLVIEMSNTAERNVFNVRNQACDMLLSHRIDSKYNGSDNNSMQKVEQRLFVAHPMKRDNKTRESVPMPTPTPTPTATKTIKEIEEENGGPGVFNFDERQHWTLKREEWKYDVIPEIYNGKNIADFYQEGIDSQLNELEHEEKQKVISMMIDAEEKNDDAEHELDADDELLASYIWRKHILMKKESAHNKKLRHSRPQIARNDKKLSLSELRYSLDDLGINTQRVSKTVKSAAEREEEALFHRRGRSRMREIDPTTLKRNENKSGLDFQEIARLQSRSRGASKAERERDRARSKSRASSRSKSRPPAKGISSTMASETAFQLKRKAIAALNRQGKVHESDRRITSNKPLHLFKGKHRPKGR